MGAAIEEIIEVEANAEAELEATMLGMVSGFGAALFLLARFLRAAAKDDDDDVVVVVVVGGGGGGGGGGGLAVNKLHFLSRHSVSASLAAASFMRPCCTIICFLCVKVPEKGA